MHRSFIRLLLTLYPELEYHMEVIYIQEFGRKIMIVALVMGLVGLCGVVNADEERISGTFSLFSPELMYFSLSDSHDSVFLRNVFYISDDEIWCSISNDTFDGVLKCVNRKGRLIDEITITDLPGDYPVVRCVTRIGDRLLIGFVDDQTLDGLVIVLDSENHEITRVNLPDPVGIMQMRSATQGILCSGFFYGAQDNIAHFYLTLVNNDGEIAFKNTELYDDTEPIHFTIQESLSCAGTEQYYAVIRKGVNGRMQPKRVLICFDQAGNISWETELPEKKSIDYMAASSDRVYLFGIVGDLSDNDILINHHAYICCYTNDGTLMWEHVFDEPEQFYRGAVNEDGCVAVSGTGTNTKEYYACSFDRDGNTRFAR